MNTKPQAIEHGTRVHHPVPKPPGHPDPHGSAELKIRGGHGLGETPGPIPNPEAKTQHGNGTAPGRVWESSTPPPQHENMGGILGRIFLRVPLFFIPVLDSDLKIPVSVHKGTRTPSKGTRLIGISKAAFHLCRLQYDLRELMPKLSLTLPPVVYCPGLLK